jgi:hypothetical protein
MGPHPTGLVPFSAKLDREKGLFIIRHSKQQGHWLISKAEILKKKDE